MARPRRKFPYFKVQYFDERSVAWRELKPGYDTAELAALAADRQSHRKTRVMRVDDEGYHQVSCPK